MKVDAVVQALLASEEPAIRYKLRAGFLEEDPRTRAMKTLRREIRDSPLARALLQLRDASGRIPGHAYAKWQGAHWTMAALADIGYPARDRSLLPLRDQLLETWLAGNFYQEFEATSKAKAYAKPGVPIMQHRHRRCASQQANALWSILRLDLVNQRTHDLVERLLHWQWPDGGWNCDKHPGASQSSFMESVLPLRALALYGRLFDAETAREAAHRAADIFLKRHLFQRQHDGSVIRDDFTTLHYPLYWHYDILHGLKILAEAGFIRDPRCRPALDLLISKQLEDGGWPAEKKYYRTSADFAHGNDCVDWGGTSKKRMNPWVTVDTLYVLKAAGYLN